MESGVYFHSSYDFMSYTWTALPYKFPKELACPMTHTYVTFKLQTFEDCSRACER